MVTALQHFLYSLIQFIPRRIFAPILTRPFRVGLFLLMRFLLGFWYGWSERPYALWIDMIRRSTHSKPSDHSVR